MKCVVPQFPDVATIDVKLSLLNTYSNSITFSNIVRPILLWSDKLAYRGGILALHGVFFTSSTICYSDRAGYLATVYASNNLILCTIPTVAHVGNWSITATNHEKQVSTSNAIVEIISATTDFKLEKENGKCTLESEIWFTGGGSILGLHCILNNRYASEMIFYNDGRSLCIIPTAALENSRSLTLHLETLPYRTNWNDHSMSFAYTCEKFSVLRNVLPRTIIADGIASSILLNGNFYNETWKCFLSKDMVAPVRMLNMTTAFCNVTTSTIGLATLTMEGVESGQLLTHKVDVVPIPVLYSILPVKGTIHGGGTVNILGYNIPDVDGIICNFNEYSSIGDLVTESEIKCPIPSVSHAGIYAISLTFTSSGIVLKTIIDVATLELFDTNVISLWPKHGSRLGGGKITLTGYGFKYGMQSSCKFGTELIVPATVLNDSCAMCIISEQHRFRRSQYEIFYSSNDQDFLNTGLVYSIDRFSPILTSLIPSRGAPGTVITIRGTGMEDSVACRFNKAKSVVPLFVNNTVVKCVAPQFNLSNIVIVEVTSNNLDYHAAPNEFSYGITSTITNIRPKTVYRERIANSSIQVYGFGFHSMLWCSFNDTIAPAHLHNLNELECTVPSLEIGHYTLAISSDRAMWHSSNTNLNVVDLIHLSNMHPTEILLPLQDASIVRLTSQNFGKAELFCNFGDIIVPAFRVNVTLVECKTPTFFAHEVIPVSVSSEDYVASANSLNLTIKEPFIITDVMPNIGTLQGGEVVIMKGKFPNLVSGCTFGNVQSHVEFVSDSTVHCVAPAFPTGGYQSIFLHIDGLKIPSGIVHEYIEHIPTLYVWPTELLTGQPTLIGGIGRGSFHHRLSHCRIGSVSGSIILEKPGTFSCEILARVSGHHELLVSYDNLSFLSTGHNLTVYEAPRLNGIHPISGTGNTMLVVRGANFNTSAIAYCLFSATKVNSRIVNSTAIQCRPPSVTSNLFEVSVVYNGYLLPNSYNFTMVQEPLITTVYPQQGSLNGGTDVYINGLYFQNGEYTCHFGHMIVEAIYFNSSQLRCVSPQAESSGVVLLDVKHVEDTLVLISFEYEELEFDQEVVKIPVIHRVEESNGVVVHGKDFHYTGSGLCLIDTNLVSLSFFNESFIVCNGQLKGSYLMISNDGISFSEKFDVTIAHTYAPLFKFYPTSGSDGATIFVNLSKHSLNSIGEGNLCTFDDMYSSPVRMNMTTLQCDVPVMIRFGSYEVKLASANTSIVTLGIFTYYPQPIVYGTPLVVYAGGTYEIEIVGARSRPYCAITGVAVSPARKISDNYVACTIPTINASEIQIGISLNGIDRYFPKNESSRLMPLPSIFSSSLAGGSDHGGDTIIFYGDGFQETSFYSVVFGIVKIPAFFINSSALFCETPSGFGNATLHLTVDHLRLAYEQVFTYVPSPEFTAVVPNAAKRDVLTHFTLEGVNFDRLNRLWIKLGDFIIPVTIFSRTKATFEAALNGDSVVFYSQDNNLFVSASLMIFSADTILRSVTPSFAMQKVHSKVFIRGSNLPDAADLKCMFNGTKTFHSVAKRWSSSKVECLTMSEMTHGDYTLSLYSSDNNISLNALQFSVRSAVKVVDLRPDVGYTTGFSRVFIAGENFMVWKHLTCDFSGIRGQATILNDSTTMCISPKTHSESLLKVSLVYENHVLVQLPKLYYSMEEPTLDRIEPSCGDISGGTKIIVYGNMFRSLNTWECIFGNIRTPAMHLSNTSLSCTSPETNPQVMNFYVSPNSMDRTQFSLRYVASKPPVLFEIEPPVISSKGGLLTVSGAFFLDISALSCIFGNIVVPAKLIATNKLTCVAPALSGVSVDLRVSNNGQDLVGARRTVPIINTILHRIEPPMGRFDGTKLNLYGTNFPLGVIASCKLSGSIFQALVVNSTYATCYVKSQTVREVLVELEFDHGYICMGRVPFLFQAFVYPRISVQSNVVAVGQESALKIKIQNATFEHGSHCMYSTKTLRSTLLSSNVLNCTIMMQEEGIHMLSVVSGDTKFPLRIRVVEPVSLQSIEPNQAISAGGSLISVFGFEFSQDSNYTCHFDLKVSKSRWVSATKLLCLSPNGHACDSSFFVCDGGVCSNSLSFRFLKMFEIVSAFPSIISHQSSVQITGKGFYPSGRASCRFNDSIVPASVVNQTYLWCRAPELQAGLSKLQVSFDGLVFSNSSVFLNYVLATENITFSTVHLTPNGERNVSVFGHGFYGNNYECSFKEYGLIVPAYTKTSKTIECNLPNSIDAQHSYAVRLYKNGRLASGETKTERCPMIERVNGHYSADLTVAIIRLRGLHFYDHTDVYCTSKFGEFVAAERKRASMAVCSFKNVKVDKLTISVHCGTLKKHLGNFTFSMIMPIQVLQVIPAFGQVSENSEPLLVHGKHFHDVSTLSCVFGHRIVAAKFISNSRIQCKPPIEGNGTVPLTFRSANPINFPEITFTYIPKFEGLSIFPSTGYVNTTVKLSGPLPFGIDRLYAKFGKFDADENKNGFVAPENLPENVPFKLSVDGMNYFTVGWYTYIIPEYVYSISPTRGQDRGGTQIKVSGVNFNKHVQYSCYFGDKAHTNASYQSQNTLLCVSPMAKRLGPVQLTIFGDATHEIQHPQEFYFVRTPRLLNLAPKSIGANSNSEVTIFGSGFLHVSIIYCSFGNRKVRAISHSDSSITCRTPSLRPQVIIVTAIADGYPCLGNLSLSYVSMPYVLAVAPFKIPIKESFNLTVYGSNFPASGIYCKFGNFEKIVANILTTERVWCLAPAMRHVQNMSISLSTLDLGTFDSATALSLQYVKNFELWKISPSHGTSKGGTDCIIYGKDFPEKEPTCHFGSNLVTGLRLSSTKVHCKSPQSRVGMVNVYVSFFDNAPRTKGLRFIYDAISLVEKITPNIGSQHGNTRVEVLGYGFSTIVNCSALFNDVRVQLYYAGPDKLHFLTPSGNERVQVQFLCDYEIIDTLADIYFEFIVEPKISHYFPLMGPVSGGTKVNIHLVQEAANLYCRFGESYLVDATIVSPTHFQCQSPSHKVGNVPISVSRNLVDFYLVTSEYLYYIEPYMSYIFPELGDETGGTKVSVIGYGFINSEYLCCKFGAAGSVSAHWISSTEIECFSPTFYPSSVGFEISNNQMDFTTEDTTQFLYQKQRQFYDLSPSTGPLEGGTIVEIKLSSKMDYVPGLRCRFGTSIVAATQLLHAEKIACRTPSRALPERVNVHISLNSIDFFPVINLDGEEVRFSYLLYPKVLEMSKSMGGDRTEIVFYGMSFKQYSHLYLKFADDGVVACNIINDTALIAQAPVINELKVVHIFISFNGFDFASTGLHFEYKDFLQISRLEPDFGVSSGGTIVSVYGNHYSMLLNYTCHFEAESTQATIVSPEEVQCMSSRHHPGSVQFSLHTEALGSNKLQFKYLKDPEILQISPNFGTIDGGTPVAVKVRGLTYTSSLTCFFEGAKVAAVYLNSSFVSCMSPQMKDSRKVIIQLSLDGIESVAWSPQAYAYYTRPNVLDMHPSIGLVQGGNNVTLTLDNLEFPDMIPSCAFGKVVSPAVYVGSSQLLCVAPSVLFPTAIEVSISLNGKDVIHTGKTYKYQANPRIQSVSPFEFPASAKTKVDIYGSGLLRENNCIFRKGNLSTSFSASFTSNTKLSCIVDNLMPGTYNVSIRGCNELPILVYHRPYISKVVPSILPWQGGALISIFGGRFRINSTVLCRVGTAVLPGSVISENEIHLISPLGASGQSVALSLSFNNESFIGNYSMEYAESALINSIEPNRGHIWGGTDVLLKGTRLPHNVTCFFGSLAVETKHVGPDLYCKSPAHVTGFESIFLKDQHNITIASLYEAFQFAKPPAIATVSPPKVPSVIESVINVWGSNFASGMFCRFNEMLNSKANFISPTHIQCTTPQRNTPGMAKLEVSLNSVDYYEEASSRLYFYGPLKAISVYPLLGPVSGGTAVQIRFHSLPFDASINCMFDNFKQVHCPRVTNSSIVCITPRASHASNFNMLVSANGVHFSPIGYFFEYVSDIELLKIFPTIGKVLGGTETTIYGENFVLNAKAKCQFGSSIVRAKVLSSTQILCKAPRAQVQMQVQVKVSLNSGVDFSRKFVMYEYANLPVVTELVPKFGSALGGTFVSVYGRHFTDTSVCRFESGHTSHAHWISSMHVRCLTPQTSPKAMGLEIGLNRMDFGNENEATFTFTKNPIVASIEIFAGERRVFVLGFGFRYSTRIACLFNDQTVPATFYNSTCISCEAPQGLLSSTLAITFNGFDFYGNQTLSLKTENIVNRIYPTHGPSAGGSNVWISGTFYDTNDTLYCSFGSETVQSQVHSNELVSCISPPAASHGTVPFSLTNSLVPSKTVFFYLNIASRYRLMPNSGSIFGGTPVTIFGMDFLAVQDLQCSFGGELVPAHFSTNTELFCVSPESVVGAVNVSIHVNKQALVEVGEYLYEIPALIKLISPDFGHQGTRSLISITGSYFTRRIRCLFDNVAVPTLYFNSSYAQCETPILHKKELSLQLANNGIDASAPTTFRVLQHIEAFMISIRQGTLDGGQTVLVRGRGFVPGYLSCYFGDENVKAISVNATNASCKVPSRSHVGDVRFLVSNDGQTFSNSHLQFTYLPSPVLRNVRPKSSNDIGGTPIQVLGDNFIKDTIFCVFDGVESMGVWISENEIHCTSPKRQPGQVYLSIKGYKGTLLFHIHAAPTVSSMHPQNGTLHATTTVMFTGYNLETVQSCWFGNIESIAYHSEPGILKCMIKPQAGYGAYDVYLSDGNSKYATSSAFTYLPATMMTQDVDAIHIVPIVSSIYPNTISAIGNSPISVMGKNFHRQLYCRFGNLIVVGEYVSSMLAICTLPKHAPAVLTVEVSNNGVDFSYNGIQLKIIRTPFIQSVFPSLGPTSGSTWVNIYGAHFSEASIRLVYFGTHIAAEFHIISTSHIQCKSPRADLSGTVRVHVHESNLTAGAKDAPTFTYSNSQTIHTIYPTFASHGRNTTVMIGVAAKLNASGIICKFGEYDVQPLAVNNGHIYCPVPMGIPSGRHPVVISTNFGFNFGNPAAHYFTVHEPLEIGRIYPSSGPSTVGTVVSVYGSGFIDTIELGCLFGTNLVPANFISENEITCRSPSQMAGLVVFQVTCNGVDVSKENFQFLYYHDVSVAKVSPSQGLASGQNAIFISGNNFQNLTSLRCKFGLSFSRGHYISSTAITCIAPPMISEFRTVNIEVSNNGLVYSHSQVEYTYLKDCPMGKHCTDHHLYACPNGTYCESVGNFSLCQPGTFQPRNMQNSCLQCPVGYICPDFGMSRPIICPAGQVCNEHGLRRPSFQCPQGHFCMSGTKTDRIDDFASHPEFSKDAETEIVSFNSLVRIASMAYNAVLPETGSRRIEFAPEDFTCEDILCHPNRTLVLVAEQPYTCPIGTYCKHGVGTIEAVVKNFSTPQACYPGFFCPRGSFTPEGQGPCPTGHFCPTLTNAFPCDVGEYCPGVGNRKPLDCYPGTHNPYVGQSNCTICPTGHICPGWKRTLPEPCPSGFVCSSLGLSVPVQLCPAGFYCSEGTLTADPSDIVPFRPRPCAPGTFCLGGVAHNLTIEWTPDQPLGAASPQKCTEGTYCGPGTFSPSGTGSCFAGHYCPPGSNYPVQAPVGSFADKAGTVAPTLCFPGTYATLTSTVKCRVCPSGYSCQGYGSYVPTICAPGSYRSIADSVTCRFCPQGTWSSASGLTDISMCEPCPSGRVCGVQMMTNLTSSTPCPQGHVCGEGTTRPEQFLHQCPAGYYCFEETSPEQQYNFMCEKGYYCRRGTKGKEKYRNKCVVGYYCPPGTADPTESEIKCPLGTTSIAGADQVTDCLIKPVDVCDKEVHGSYYNKFSYNFQGDTKVIDSTGEKEAQEEVKVILKVVPINESESASYYKNDTTDAIRSCPTEGSFEGGMLLTIVGRNFFNTSRLTCGFRQPETGFITLVPATYKSRTRATCRTPPYTFNEDENSAKIQVHMANYGVKFSPTGATFLYTKNSSELIAERYSEYKSDCLKPIVEQEGYRQYEDGWFVLRGLSQAKITVDLRHIPSDMVYDEHYKIAIYVSNSTCEDQQCDSRRVRKPNGPDLLVSPCQLPVRMSNWFSANEIEKNSIISMSLLALEDVLFKVEVQIMYGIYLSAGPLFQNTTTVTIKVPSRANYTTGVQADTRPLASILSFEEILVNRDYSFISIYEYATAGSVSVPLNLPPKYEDFDRGRVLMSYNATDRPTILDDYSSVKTDSAYWAMPTSSEEETLEKIKIYRETFHEMYRSVADDSLVFQFSKVILPYLPYFSNCKGYDSYIPIFEILENDKCELPELTLDYEEYGTNWWRREFPPFPHQDDITHVGPADVGKHPIADWCELTVQCAYEEVLGQADVTPRWFEAPNKETLFHILREPVTLAQYQDGGKHYDKMLNEYNSDIFIPVEIDREAASRYEGGCTRMCFPRTVTMDISYYQLSPTVKRFIKIDLVLDDFDKNVTRQDYDFHVSYHAMDYTSLIIAFAFDREVFIILFICIGMFSCAVAFAFWVIVRLTTRLQRPPKFRFWSYFALTAPPPALGTVLGLMPVMAVIGLFWFLLNGYKVLPFSYEKYMAYWLLDQWASHYTISKLDPETVQSTRAGRTGLCFLTLSLYLLYSSTFVFLPKRISIQERIAEQKKDKSTESKSIWAPTMWKRSNLMFTSIMLGLFLVVLVEFSFWEDFGTYIWFVILAFEFVTVYIEGVLENQLKEALLLAPLSSALSLTMGLVTFGSDDFKDFLLGYTLDFGIVLIQRVYLDAALDVIFKFFGNLYNSVVGFFHKIWLFFYRKTKKGKAKELADAAAAAFAEEDNTAKVETNPEDEDTVEPIIDSYGGYAMDILAIFYQPFIILLMIIFRDEMVLPVLYGIRQQDMEYYLWFSLIIIFFQLVADILIHNVLELFHGWKIYDYLVYVRYRFIQRETRWKGMELHVDECIEEGMRSLDQMCFSSQFYMMCTFHVTAIMTLVISIEIMIRYTYNMFGDPAMLALVPFVLVSCITVRKTMLHVAMRIEFWKIKHEGTAWHSMPGEDDELAVPKWEELEKLKGASHEAFLMNQRISSETFRYKFLNYNRPWIMSQLPNILTPRTLRRGRPYLLTQFTKILGNLNPDVSSDDSEDDEASRPRFGPVSLTAPSRNIIRLWLAQARRRQRLRSSVQPIINQNRKVECEVCLSRRQLQVEMVIPLEVMGRKFEKQSHTEEFDVRGWKEFFTKHQKFRTLCLTCAVRSKKDEPQNMNLLGRANYSDSGDDAGTGKSSFSPVYLNAASSALMKRWYSKAQDRVFGKTGKRRQMVNISDDDDDDIVPQKHDWSKQKVDINASSTAIARKWLMAARGKLKVKYAGKPKPTRDEILKPQSRKVPGKTSGNRKSRQRRK